MSDRNQQPDVRRLIAPLWEVLLFAIALAILAQLDLYSGADAANRVTVAATPVVTTYPSAHDSLPAHLALSLANHAAPQPTSGS